MVILLELLKCLICISLSIIAYRIMVALETIAGKKEDSLRGGLHRDLKVHGKVILILSIFTILFFIGTVARGVYIEKRSNYKEIWKWKPEISTAVDKLKGYHNE